MEGALGLFPGQGAGSHMLQLKILHATTKASGSQINKYFLKSYYISDEKGAGEEMKGTMTDSGGTGTEKRLDREDMTGERQVAS